MPKRLVPHFSQKYNQVFIVSLIMIIGFAFRFYGLDKDSYALDEGASIYIADRSYLEIFQMEAEPNPPLFYSILHVWIKWFGTAEGSTRLLPAFFSILALFFSYKLAKLLWGLKAGWLLALILAISPHQIYFAQELRSYSLLFFLSVISTYYFIWLSDRRSKRLIIFYIISTVLLLLTHIYGWFVFLAHIVWIFIFNRSQIKYWLLNFTIIGILFSPYLFYFLPTLWQVSGNFWLARPGFIHFFGGGAALMGSTWLFGLYFIIILSSIYYNFRKRFTAPLEDRNFYFPLLWICTAYILPFVTSQFMTPFFQDRYLIVAVFPIVLVLVYLILKFQSPVIRTVYIILIILFSGIEIYEDMSQPTREPWRNMALDLGEQSNKEDLFVVAAGFCIENIMDHYTQALSQQRIGVAKEDMEQVAWQNRLAARIDKDAKTVWLIISHFNSNENRLIHWFEDHYQMEETYNYTHRDIFGRQVIELKMIRFASQ